MRFQQFIENVVNPTVQANHETIRDLAQNIDGGWEVWLQVELYLRLTELDRGLEEFVREPKYPNSTLRADFCFAPANAPETTTWVELKVEKKQDASDALKRFGLDVDKLHQVHLPVNDTAGAVACIPVGVEAAIELAREVFGKQSKVRYYLVQPDQVSRQETLAEDPMLGDDEILVIYLKRS